ncbi:MAG: rhomboid family intramembrane serine protease, partial [Myxococcales bacterium]|nr:rhomboid family intramembrane serine protease [Myxococcales bacterium]
NLFSGLSTLGKKGGGVAFFAHLGGFVAGLLLVRVFFDRDALRHRTSWEGWRTPTADGNGAPRDPARHERHPWQREDDRDS